MRRIAELLSQLPGEVDCEALVTAVILEDVSSGPQGGGPQGGREQKERRGGGGEGGGGQWGGGGQVDGQGGGGGGWSGGGKTMGRFPEVITSAPSVSRRRFPALPSVRALAGTGAGGDPLGSNHATEGPEGAGRAP
ncbi:hypothetical protein Agub_g13390 [Astrephomene gubernaculifera]|uniref:Uncharacterized protein n=1 Tax=Astrephomene gubernaculifera TaxID=47775 RepID=A0AAD3HSA1_9CHLO|nr:hypothetical protein Agub_g13390 [Astrephomene gubernaculifera]